MNQIKVPISVGELIDKVTILQIKKERISDPVALQNIGRELEALTEVCQQFSIDLNTDLVQELKKINETLWQIEDDIRICEREKNFSQKFIDLARSVYKTNDERFRVKRLLNKEYDSAFVEEKSYEDI